MILSVASAALLSACDRIPGVSEFQARRGLENCMGRRTDSITYLYVGSKAVCGVVDITPFRGEGPPVGLSPFIYHRAPKPVTPRFGGPDYEDYVLNRVVVDANEGAANTADIVSNCGIPHDWEKACGQNTGHPAASKPSFCTLMATPDIIALNAHPNGCPS